MLLSAGLIGLIGCFGSPERPPTDGGAATPFAGQELQATVPAGLGFSSAWKPILDEWAAQTGAVYRIREVDSSGSPRSAGKSWASLLETGEGDSSSAVSGLVVFPITEIADLAAAGLLAPIPAEQRSSENLNWPDLFQGLRENVASVEQQPLVVPVSSPVLIYYYRRDLLEKAGLSPPGTWEEYQKLLETLDRWAPGMTAVEPWGEEFRATMFLARAVSYAKHPAHFSVYFDEETGEPLIDRPSFVRALEDAQAALAKMPPTVTGYSPRDCRRDLLAGKAALAISFETGPGIPTVPFGPNWPPEKVAGTLRVPSAADKTQLDAGLDRPEAVAVGFNRLPGVREVYDPTTRAWGPTPDRRTNQVTLTAFGGLCAGVSSASSPLQAQAAWNLLATLAMDHLETAFPGATKSPCRQSQLAEQVPWTGDDLTAAESQQYLEAVASSLRETRIVSELPVIGRTRFRAALTEQLGEVLAGRAETQAALSAAAEKWRQISEEVGREIVRDSYRRSLGLRPL